MLFSIYEMAGSELNFEAIAFFSYLMLFGALLIIAQCEAAHSLSTKVILTK